MSNVSRNKIYPMNKQLFITKLNRIFGDYDFGIQAEENDFSFLKEAILDTKGGGRISEHLNSLICPPIHELEFYHYTPFDAGQNILQTQKLRLTSVEKRLNDNEIHEFLNKFNYTYPLENDPDTNQPRYKNTLATDLFYVSMTDISLSQKEEDSFWRKFAESDGFRLKFKVNVPSGCLRRMTYGSKIDKWAEFSKEIQSMSFDDFGKHFHWKDCVPMSAFYLPEDYEVEKETRLLIRSSWGLKEKEDKGNRFVELDFGFNESTGINLSLIEIQTDQIITPPTGMVITPRT